jgi:Na+/H+ antiporter NhaD/arsenite permease-like protein
MIAIFATNVGSCGTVLGNPIGVLIAMKSGLTFEDFLLKAFPVMLVCLASLIFILKWWFRSDVVKLDVKMKELGANDILIKLISVPPEKELKIGLGIFGATLAAIALHHRIEVMLDLAPNTVLLILPLISSGLVMAWKRTRARSFIEKDVEWWTLLFFLLLFAQAGTLQYTGAADAIARRLVGITTNNVPMLTGAILWISTIGSSVLDNVVLVAAVIPVVQSFSNLNIAIQPLWWALLFGGCFGGNITLVGSTANIVALGLLEKEHNIHMQFMRWFKIGLVVGVVTTLIAWAALTLLPVYR